MLPEVLYIFPDVNIAWLQSIEKYYQDNEHKVERITEKLLAQHGKYPKESPDCKARNEILYEISSMFPDLEPFYCRQLIQSSKYCETQIIDLLLKQGSTTKGYPRCISKIGIQQQDFFQPQAYIDAVCIALLSEFPHHYKSTIMAVMAETNNYYVDAHRKMSDTNPGFLWSSILPFLSLRSRSKIEANNLLLSEHKIHVLNLRETKNDSRLAIQLNLEQYQLNGQLIACLCCFSDYTFEELAQCQDGHLFCKFCIESMLNEGLYGHGNLRGKPLFCMSSDHDCQAEFTDASIQQAVSGDLYRNYLATFFAKSMTMAGIVAVNCPFCEYMEESPGVKAIGVLDLISNQMQRFHIKVRHLTWIVSIGAILLATNTFEGLYFSVVVLIATMTTKPPELVKRVFRMFQKYLFPAIPAPVILQCKNKSCMRASCIGCNKEWSQGHKCHEEVKDSLRLHVENAMSQALIRTCPECKIRFSKMDGCNKMTCSNCSYVMCYICRQNIRLEGMSLVYKGYSHFCQHFRIIPGSECGECKKCDLYQKEVDERTVKAAAKKAKEEWMNNNPSLCKTANQPLRSIGPSL